MCFEEIYRKNYKQHLKNVNSNEADCKDLSPLVQFKIFSLSKRPHKAKAKESQSFTADEGNPIFDNTEAGDTSSLDPAEPSERKRRHESGESKDSGLDTDYEAKKAREDDALDTNKVPT